MISRRQLLRGAGAAIAAGAVTGLYTWRVEPEWLELVERDLAISGLPASLDGALMAQLSDLHIGPRVRDEYIARTFERVTERQPDLVVMTGDWITYRGPQQFDQLARLLERFPRGRLGTVGILGNHDYGFRWRMPQVADRVTELTTAAGIHLLRNQSVAVGGLNITGLEDLWGPNFSGARSALEQPTVSARLVLSHNPDAADEPIWQPYQGWILAGHTHGGQCKPPFLPPPLLPVKNRRYTAGAFELSGSRQLYISRGVGYLIRVRFNVRPEVTLFRLRRA